ncbi:MAG: preprotein translocase subunit SecG [Crocinitomicaceae bacterium]|jgi:preprotein translocase subunit SecG|nr:preprotein translocase subunit SecG [Crocinitomicaceae bacterium]
MDFILSALLILSSILLILVVYVQNPKGGGISSDFGSPSQLGGVQKSNEFIDKLTWSLAGIIVAASILITIRQPKPPKPIEQKAPKTEQNGNQQAPADGKTKTPAGGQ